MRKPRRIQRKRVKGWRLPHGATCVAPPGKWGNPFATASEFREVMKVVALGFVQEPKSLAWQKILRIHQDIEQLRGFDLACFCMLDNECHADTLLDYANRENNHE